MPHLEKSGERDVGISEIVLKYKRIQCNLYTVACTDVYTFPKPLHGIEKPTYHFMLHINRKLTFCNRL